MGKVKEDTFLQALQGKKIPILTLDNKWYRLLDEAGREAANNLTEELNTLLRRQGKLNTETKDIKALKKRLMSEIVSMVDEAEKGKKEAEKQLEQNKRLIAECNDKLEAYQDELLELPREIERVNFKLMLLTMECCYDTMQENKEQIQQIADWVTQIRIALKKNLIRKQEMEQKNQAIYAYMHDVFGADVVDLFDMKSEKGNNTEV